MPVPGQKASAAVTRRMFDKQFVGDGVEIKGHGTTYQKHREEHQGVGLGSKSEPRLLAS